MMKSLEANWRFSSKERKPRRQIYTNHFSIKYQSLILAAATLAPLLICWPTASQANNSCNSGSKTVSYGDTSPANASGVCESITINSNAKIIVVNNTTPASKITTSYADYSFLNNGVVSSYASSGGAGIINEVNNPILSIINSSSGRITNFGTAILNYGNVSSDIRNDGEISGSMTGIGNAGSVYSIKNNGSIQAVGMAIHNTGTVAGDITNSGMINVTTEDGYAILNEGYIGSIINNSTGFINKPGDIYNMGTIRGIQNSGLIDSSIDNISVIADPNIGIRNTSGGTIAVINNASTGLIESQSAAIRNDNSSIIDAIYNTGRIIANNQYLGQSGDGIYNNGTINTINNYAHGVIDAENNGAGISLGNSGYIGTINNYATGGSPSKLPVYFDGIQGPNGGIDNTAGGTIKTINNAQGAQKPLWYQGNLPENYNIIVNSTQSFGRLAIVLGNASAPVGFSAMAFGIADGSILMPGHEYNSVLINLMDPSLISNLAGNYGGLSWSLHSSGSAYSLWVSDASPDIATGAVYFATNYNAGMSPVFAGGTLRLNQVDATYSENYSLSNDPTNTIDQYGNTSTITGNLTDATNNGRLTIVNSRAGGSIIFTGQNTYTGPTTVSDGATAVINGSMLSNFIVDSGGALKGNGSFGGGVINGLLAPGNSIGTITSNGNLTFGNGSTYQVEVNSSGTSDLTIVNGLTNIQGGTVAVSGDVPTSPSSLPKTKYTIIRATNGIVGKFSNLTGLPGYSFLMPTLAYGANDVSLGWALTPFSAVGRTINQRNVGNALTMGAYGPISGPGANILNTLFYGSYQSAQSVMDTVGGAGLAGVQTTAMEVGQMASSTVSDQIAFWRSGETNDMTGVTLHENNGQDRARSFMAYAPTDIGVTTKNPITIKGPVAGLSSPVPAARTYRAWGSMFGGGANFLSDAGRGTPSATAGYYGGLLGVDYQLTPNALIGVSLGGSSAGFSVGSLSTTGSLTGFHAGLYASYTMGASYLALNETFSAYSNKTNRSAGGYSFLPYESLSANFGSTEFRTRLEGGHSLLMGGLKATPFIAAEIAAYNANGFSEKSSLLYQSSLALKNNGQAINSLPTFLGLRLSNAYTLENGWRLAPIGSLAYVHEFFPQRQFTNILMSMPGQDFNVAGPRSTYNLVQTKLGAQLFLNKAFALYSDFQGEFSPMSQSYGGTAGMKYYW
jgi:outer membrane autotransporter protein